MADKEVICFLSTALHGKIASVDIDKLTAVKIKSYLVSFLRNVYKHLLNV